MRYPWLATPALALLPSCSWLITPPEATPQQPFTWKRSAEETPLLVFSHGYHTGLSLPAESLREHLPHLCHGLTDEWLEFGWGDEGFYRSVDITAPLVFSALCYPTPGVVHVVAQEPPIHRHYHYAPIRLLTIDLAETKNLGKFLADTFKKDENGNLINLGPGRYGKSSFFRANQSYYFPRSCNAWTAKGLQASGFDVYSLTAPGLMKQLPRENP
ncbi:MAG: DUF2459 domain-containing protein [Roseibacillus sp.]